MFNNQEVVNSLNAVALLRLGGMDFIMKERNKPGAVGKMNRMMQPGQEKQ
jgi:hypothetical protein